MSLRAGRAGWRHFPPRKRNVCLEGAEMETDNPIANGCAGDEFVHRS